MANLFLLCGMSGAGKTYFGNQFWKNNRPIEWFDADDYYRDINGDECIRDNAFEVWHRLFKSIHVTLEAGTDVLIITNSLHHWEREDFLYWFPEATHHVIWLAASFERCMKQNLMRRRKVPNNVMRKQYDTMEIPDSREDWDTITHLVFCDNDDSVIICKIKGDIEKYLSLKLS
jgi:predicted kinase